jgi:hypothetical protein
MERDEAINLLGQYMSIDLPRECGQAEWHRIRAAQTELVNRMLASDYAPLVAVAIRLKTDKGAHNCRQQIEALLTGRDGDASLIAAAPALLAACKALVRMVHDDPRAQDNPQQHALAAARAAIALAECE